jgi:hypothetical protein
MNLFLGRSRIMEGSMTWYRGRVCLGHPVRRRTGWAGFGCFLSAFLLGLLGTTARAQSNAEGIELFEKAIRPVLAEKCYVCHSAATAAMADLLLDSASGLRKGGSRGPAVVPSEPAKSLLLKAISYTDLDLRMPPAGKLSDEQIEAFHAWIRLGAPDPRVEQPAAQPAAVQEGIDLEAGRKFWAFQPLKAYPAPAADNGWPASPIDHFLLRKLKEKNISPAPQADKRTLLRRASFDLTGLPPTPEEIEAFLNDDSPQAFAKVVDRLLASPHYGERWARHWLDLVRFAETNGHEFDNNKLDAYRYRDYVIRAFNGDVPYDQFTREHIAGDLLAARRPASDASYWESPLGTGFYWFGEVLNSATDSEKTRADEVDNQIDVLSKAFLGLTVACARCHDHKFDPIPTADYYSLAGILHSTDLNETSIDSPETIRRIEALHSRIVEENRQVRELLAAARPRQIERIKTDLLRAAEFLPVSGQTGSGEKDAPNAEEWAKEQGLDARVAAWARYLNEARAEPDHVFFPFAALASERLSEGSSFAQGFAEIRRQLQTLAEKSLDGGKNERGDVVFEDFERTGYGRWRAAGRAFGAGPDREPIPSQPLRNYDYRGAANSFHGADAFVGTLTSEKFKMPKLYVHVRIAGSKSDKKLGENAKLRLTVVADAHKSAHAVPSGSGALEWQTLVMTKEIGRTCYFEIVDRDRQGHIAIDKIVFSDSPEPPSASISAEKAAWPNRHVLAMLEQAAPSSLADLAGAYQDMFRDRLGEPATSGDTTWLLASLSPTGKLEDEADLLDVETRAKLDRVRQDSTTEIPGTTFAMVSRDENPHDIAIHLRGNHKNLGERVPRRFLQVLALAGQAPFEEGSGRLQLAERLADPGNPLLARVMVNRIWMHHFGRGIVASTDNFGKTGDRPTHPELLDFLARKFIDSGWSVKAMHRLMLLSSAYRMSNQVDETAAAVDPTNQLLHHMPVRRLEAEIIRDAILAAAGTLDPALYGPSVMPHISEYQDGRGKPPSGPLDGNGRRSIYLQIRRNFLPPLFLAFDYPLPISTIGRRSASTVASQALILMNNEFVAQEAAEWGRRVVSRETDVRRRIEWMFVTAFARPAAETEIDEVRAFLEEQQTRYGGGHDADDPRVWADLAHVLFNSTEFLFVR